MKRFIFFIASIGWLAASCANRNGGDLESAFTDPPESTKPWVYWYWISDNISKEGITRDLEAMARVGIGEALIGNVVDAAVKPGEVKVLSEEWWGCVEHAIAEADRLGIKVGMFNCPGWSMSGGPWIQPEKAMRYLVSNEFNVTGPVKLSQKLDVPGPNFQPVSVQAFPAPRMDGDRISDKKFRLKSSGIDNAAALFDGDPGTAATLVSYPATVEIELDGPVTWRTLELHPVEEPMTAVCTLESKDSEDRWTPVVRREIDRGKISLIVGPMLFGPVCETFPPVTGKEFRLVFTDGQGGKLSEIELSGAARLSYYIEKQLGKMSPRPEIYADTYLWEPSTEPDDPALVIESDKVIDLNAAVTDGVLTWDVPEGEWIVLYTGMLPTGTKNGPTTREGRGLEVDKMNKEYAQYHFDSFIGELLRRLPPEKRKGLRHVVADSYEQSSENWTEGFAEDFRSTYGYDPHPWLPVLTGRVIDNAELSDRFLWDMRRLIADRIATEYVGGLREKAEESGMRLWLENYGHWGYPGEFLKYGGASHDLGGEFWLSNPSLGPIEVRCASSAAHIYGKPVVSCESFTSSWTFNQMPRDLKTRGDWSWTEGINHFVLHVYIHQPDERKPGMSAWFGTDFNRHSTWFEDSKSYFDYVRRSCALLQRGANVADIAYFIGEDAPIMTGDTDPALPAGYDYDFINAEVLLGDVEVEKGRITLASGASYAILVLPPRQTMRPAVLERLAELVKAGATVLGPAPLRSPSLQGFPESDVRVKSLAEQMWGDIDGTHIRENPYGKGRVMVYTDLREALVQIGVREDVTLPADLLYTHRHDDGADIYFLSNQSDREVKETLSFRVDGKQPELWDAVTGEIRLLPEFGNREGRTDVPLEFGPGDSWFVVFRRPAGKGLAGVNFPPNKPVAELHGDWEVRFTPAYAEPFTKTFDGLTDWKASEDPNVRYFSGTAAYRKDFDFRREASEAVYLDLGRVEGLATVILNGTEFPTLWRYPYRAEVKGVLREGKNTLEVKITNCWWNRLVGDAQPDAVPVTWSAYTGWDADSPLLPSGLLGPVTLQAKQ